MSVDRRRRLAAAGRRQPDRQRLRAQRAYARYDLLLLDTRGERVWRTRRMVRGGRDHLFRYNGNRGTDVYSDSDGNADRDGLRAFQTGLERQGRQWCYRTALAAGCRRGALRAVDVDERRRLAAAGRRRPDRQRLHAQRGYAGHDLLVRGARGGCRRRSKRMVGAGERVRFRRVNADADRHTCGDCHSAARRDANANADRDPDGFGPSSGKGHVGRVLQRNGRRQLVAQRQLAQRSPCRNLVRRFHGRQRTRDETDPLAKRAERAHPGLERTHQPDNSVPPLQPVDRSNPGPGRTPQSDQYLP